jgi:hypothetical protein
MNLDGVNCSETLDPQTHQKVFNFASYLIQDNNENGNILSKNETSGQIVIQDGHGDGRF